MRTILSLLTFLIALAAAPAFGQNAFRFYGRAISSSPPTAGQAFVWNNTSKRYELTTVTASTALSALTTVGAVPIVTAAGVLGQDASNFAWDAATHRLTLGASTSTYTLNVHAASPLGGIGITSAQDNFGVNLTGTGSGARAWGIYSAAGASGAGAGALAFYDATAGAFRVLFNTTGVAVAGAVRPIAVAVASLPTPTLGMLATVNNANANTIGTTVAGGGSNNVLVWYNGTNWRIAAN